MKQYAFVVDLDRCIGCKGCQVACKMENEIALGRGRINVNAVGPNGTFPDLEMYFMPTMCQQCADPSCVKVCPTGACYKNTEDGVVMIDQDLCIGCQSCQNACPYQANSLNRERNVMDKCTMCAQLRETGEHPACVKNCSGRALKFGDICDPSSEVSQLLKEAGEENVYHLRDFGDGPSVRYILRKAEWKDMLPQEIDEIKGRKLMTNGEQRIYVSDDKQRKSIQVPRKNISSGAK